MERVEAYMHAVRERPEVNEGGGAKAEGTRSSDVPCIFMYRLAPL